MRRLRAALSRIQGAFGRARLEREWNDEIECHLRMHIEDNLRAGMNAEEARRNALIKFGAVEPAREAYRDRRGLPSIEAFLQDLRYGVRTLLKQPGFTAVVVLTLALGVGANTAMFSLIDAVLLKMLPVPHPEQLVSLFTGATQVGSVSLSRTILNRDLEQMQKRSTRVAGMASYSTTQRLNLGVAGHSQLASGHFVSGTYFDVLGVEPMLGRAIDRSDEHAGGRVAMLGFGYWQRRFGASASVLGEIVTINSVPFTIIGVTPREFYGLDVDASADVMMPMATQSQVEAGHISNEEPMPDTGAGYVFARLKDGVSVASAEAELGITFREAERDARGTAANADQSAFLEKLSIELKPAGQALSSARNRFSKPLAVLMVVVALVMLIACANIANLLLAKSGARQREIVIRLSLGSSRVRLVRQLLTESLLFSLLGGALGILLAVWARNGIVYLATTAENAPVIPAEWNLRVLGFTTAVCILNAFLFGLAPALRATGVDLVSMLKGGLTNRRPGRFRLGRILVVGQVALSLTLLIGAGLFLGTFRNLDRIDPGFDRERVLMLTMDPAMAGLRGAKAVQIFKSALERTGAIPGVRAVTLLRDRILTGQISMTSIFVPGYALRSGETAGNQWVISNAVGPRFLEIAGMRLIAGRDFTEQDNEKSLKVAILNQTMARHFFDGKNPIGQHITWARNEPPIEVVGLVRDIAYMGLSDTKQDVVLTPILQADADSWNKATLFVRTATDSPRIAADIRALLKTIDPNVPVYAITTMNRQVQSTLVQQRLVATLTSFFGVLAMVLSAVGLYGVVSYGIEQRTNEIGLRMALGASRASILNLALGETARLAGTGILLGIGMAVAAARFIQSMLYGITPADTGPLAISIGILTAVALLAGFLPARRASRIDPLVALRYE